MLTAGQFYSEVCSLRQAWGTKAFWADKKVIRQAHKALGIIYLQTQPANDKEREHIASTFMATMREFIRRGELLGIDVLDIV